MVRWSTEKKGKALGPHGCHSYVEHRKFAEFSAAGLPTVIYISIFYIHSGGPQAAWLWHSHNSALGAELDEHYSWATLRLPVDALDSHIFGLLWGQHLCPSGILVFL